MFELFRRKAFPRDLSQIKASHIADLVKSEGPKRAGEILEKAALAGSTDAAVYFSVLIGQHIDRNDGIVSEAILKRYVYFTEMAAERGDSASQYNLAQHFLKEVDVNNFDRSGYESLKKAETWYRRSASDGFPAAIQSVEELSELFEWANGRFRTGAVPDLGCSDGVEHQHSDNEAEGQISFRECIASQGWDRAIEFVSNAIVERISDVDLAYEFVLQELDGARQGGLIARSFAEQSGFAPDEYIGALEHANARIDGPRGPQQLLLALSMQLSDEPDNMARFRCSVVDAIQSHFGLGKYS